MAGKRSKREHGQRAEPLRAVLNAIDAIDELGRSSSGMGVRELARVLRLTPATTQRVLSSLEECRVVRQDSETLRYLLDVRLLEIVAAQKGNFSLGETARRHMIRLQERTRETVFLGILDRGEVVIVERIDSPQALRMASELGTREPLHCTALGKAMLAGMGADEAESAIVDAPLQAFTARTLTTKRALRAELAKTAKRGWAIDDEEHIAGVRCIAAAIRNDQGRVIGAISSAGPVVRLTDDRLPGMADAVCASAASTSADLGYAPRLPRRPSRRS